MVKIDADDWRSTCCVRPARVVQATVDGACPVDTHPKVENYTHSEVDYDTHPEVDYDTQEAIHYRTYCETYPLDQAEDLSLPSVGPPVVSRMCS